MKIGITLYPYGENSPAGLARYIFDLTKSLVENDPNNEYIIFLKENPKNKPVFAGSNWKIHVLGYGPFWRSVGFWFAPKADIYIFNTPRLPMFFKPKRSLVIILDFAYYVYTANSFSFKNYINKKLLFVLNKLSLMRASKIISISNATKDECSRIFGTNKDNIEVIYPGFRNICDVPSQEIDIDKPYVLFVGIVKERKNVYNLVAAFIESKKNDSINHKLVIVGKTGGEYLNRIMDLIRRSGMEDEIIFVGRINDNELSYIYKNADVFVFPSIIEGFGMPVLEAMACGIPVITSAGSSLSEVAGDAALKVDPLNVGEISKAITLLAKDSKAKDDLILKGSIRCKEFSWEKSAHKFINAINKLI
jgi:glycosyltransferase involved in cell wall biosynthesis